MKPKEVLRSSKEKIRARLLRLEDSRRANVLAGDLNTALWLEHFGSGLRHALDIIEREEKK